MNQIDHLADAIEEQTQSHAISLAEDVVAGRVGLTDYVKIEIGVYLGILGRLGATEMAIKDLYSLIRSDPNFADYR